MADWRRFAVRLRGRCRVMESGGEVVEALGWGWGGIVSTFAVLDFRFSFKVCRKGVVVMLGFKGQVMEGRAGKHDIATPRLL